MREVADELSADAGDGKARILLMTMTVEPSAVLGPALGQGLFRSNGVGLAPGEKTLE